MHNQHTTYNTGNAHGRSVNDYYEQPGYQESYSVAGQTAAVLGDVVETTGNGGGIGNSVRDDYSQPITLKLNPLNSFDVLDIKCKVTNNSDIIIGMESLLDFKKRLTSNVVKYSYYKLDPFLLPIGYDADEFERIKKLEVFNITVIRYGSKLDKKITQDFNTQFKGKLRTISFVDDYLALVGTVMSKDNKTKPELKVAVREWIDSYIKSFVIWNGLVGIPKIKWFIVGVPKEVKEELIENDITVSELYNTTESALHGFLEKLSLNPGNCVLVNETNENIFKG